MVDPWERPGTRVVRRGTGHPRIEKKHTKIVDKIRDRKQGSFFSVLVDVCVWISESMTDELELKDFLPGYGMELPEYDEIMKQYETKMAPGGSSADAAAAGVTGATGVTTAAVDSVYGDAFDPHADREIYSKRDEKIPPLIAELMEIVSSDLKRHIVVPSQRLEWYMTLHEKLCVWIESSFERTYTRKNIGTIYVQLSLAGAVARLLIVVHKTIHRKRIASMQKAADSNPISDFFAATEAVHDACIVYGNGAGRPESADQIANEWERKLDQILDEAVRATNDLVAARKINQEKEREKQYYLDLKAKLEETEAATAVDAKKDADLAGQKKTPKLKVSKRAAKQLDKAAALALDSDVEDGDDNGGKDSPDVSDDGDTRMKRASSSSSSSSSSDSDSADSPRKTKQAKPTQKTEQERLEDKRTFDRFGKAYRSHKKSKPKASLPATAIMDTTGDDADNDDDVEAEVEAEAETKARAILQKKQLAQTVQSLEIKFEAEKKTDGIKLDELFASGAGAAGSEQGVNLHDIEVLAKDENKQNLLGQGIAKETAKAELEASGQGAGTDEQSPFYAMAAALDKPDEDETKIRMQVEELSDDVYETVARFVWWIRLQLRVLKSRKFVVPRRRDWRHERARLRQVLSKALFRDKKRIQPSHELGIAVERMIYGQSMPCGTRLRYLQLKPKALRDNLPVVVMNVALKKGRALKVSEMATALDLAAVFRSGEHSKPHTFYQLLLLALFIDYMEINHQMDNFFQRYVIDVDNLSESATIKALFQSKRDGEMQFQRPKMLCLFSRWWIIGTEEIEYCESIEDMICAWCNKVLVDFDGTMEDEFAIDKILREVCGDKAADAAKDRRTSALSQLSLLYGQDPLA
jgi:hypothetical protein